MAQKQVRICDRCSKEREYVTTTEWSTIKIALPKSEGKDREDTYDLCDKCTYALKCFITDYAHPAEEIKR